MNNCVLKTLNELKDESYAAFSRKLVPDTSYPILGVRVPKLKAFAKELIKDDDLSTKFLNGEHVYYEEYFLHALVVAYKFKELNVTLERLNEFLPSVDNWAICDSLSAALKIFKKDSKIVFDCVKVWLKSNKPYVIRFGVVVLLLYYLDKNFTKEVFELIKNVKSDNYYVNMAIAWLISVALVKQYENTIELIENKVFPAFIHNKAIQKAVESFRISKERKSYLKTLKIKQIKGENL